MLLKANIEEAETSVSEKGNEKLSVQPDQSLTEITEAPAFQRCQDSVLQVPLGDWTTLRLGEGQCDITEACVEGMRAGEKCEVRVKRGLDKMVHCHCVSAFVYTQSIMMVAVLHM